MNTGYFIVGKHIYGPEVPGQFFIDAQGKIRGPKNSGQFSVDDDGYIRGPRADREFYLKDNHIYGSSKTLPWTV